MALEQKYVDLINADIDGELEAGEKANLEALLADDAEARALHAELADVAARLDRLPELTPPPHLKHLVMSQRKEKPAVPRQGAREPGFFERLAALPALGYIGTFGAGVIFTLVLVNSSQVRETAFDDMTDLVGTIADNNLNAPVHGSVSVDETSVAGTITLRSTGSILIIDADLAAREAVDIVARYADRTIWFNGFAQLESAGADVAAEPGAVRVRVEGKRRYALYLHNPDRRPASITLEVMSDGDVIHESVLDYRGSD